MPYRTPAGLDDRAIISAMGERHRLRLETTCRTFCATCNDINPATCPDCPGTKARPMNIINDANRELTLDILSTLNGRDLCDIGTELFSAAEDAGLVHFGTESSACTFPHYEWEIDAVELVTLGGGFRASLREGQRLLRALAASCLNGHGQGTDAERADAVAAGAE